MALYSDNDSLEGPAQKFTMQSVGRQSLVTAPFIVEVTPVSEHEMSLTWQVVCRILLMTVIFAGKTCLIFV